MTRKNSKLLVLQAEGQKTLAQVNRERHWIEIARLNMENAIALLSEHRQQAFVLQTLFFIELKNRRLRLTQQADEEQEF